ncbi:hypothetical protein AHAS_Ahas19G0293100 [Arachis hypogaea]
MANLGLDTIKGMTISLNSNPSPGFKPECYNIVGKIMFDKKIKFKVIKNSILGMWKNPKDVSISEVDRNTVLISFKDNQKRKKILKNSSWNVRGNLLNLLQWVYDQFILDV